MHKFCTFLRLFVLKLFCGNICIYVLVVHLGTLCSDLYCLTISGDRTFCDWKFSIINFVITKYHKIIIYFLKMWPFPNFHLLIFKNSIFCGSALFISFFSVYFLLAYLYAKLFFVYGSWICIFFMNIFGNRSINCCIL